MVTCHCTCCLSYWRAMCVAYVGATMLQVLPIRSRRSPGSCQRLRHSRWRRSAPYSSGAVRAGVVLPTWCCRTCCVVCAHHPVVTQLTPCVRWSPAQTLCPAGRYGSSTGETTSACSGTCANGYTCPPGSTSPTQERCTQGYYCNGGAETPCPAGRYALCVGRGCSFHF